MQVCQYQFTVERNVEGLLGTLFIKEIKYTLFEITLFTNPVHILIRKDVRQGDLLSPCSSLPVLRMNGEGGFNVNDKWLTHLRFAGDMT